MSLPHERKGRSIQSRLILLLLLILIPVLAIQSYMYYDSYQTRRTSELQANLEIARLLAKAFESFVQDVIHQELAIGVAITSSQPMPSRDITRLLGTSRDDVAVRDFTWINPKGVAIYSSNPAMIGINYGDRSYFREIVNGRDWMVGELVIAKSTGEPVFGISRGIRDGKGTLLGIVFASIIPEKLDAQLAVERSKGGGYAIVDNKGMLVYRYPAIEATWEERNWLKPYPEFGEALKGKEIATTVYAPYEGKNRLVGFTPISSVGWAASAGKREEDVTGPILSSIGKNALLFLFFSFAAFFVALAVSRKIASPVTALRNHALALGHGELPEQVKINHILEFQDLADAFNTMAEKVQAREMDLRESEKRERERAAELEAIFVAHNDATLVYDTEMNVRLVTPSFFTIYGFDPIGLNVREIIQRVSCRWLDGRPFKLEDQPTPRALAGEKVTGAIFAVKRADGTEAVVETSSGPILMGDHITGSVTVWQDITERKQAEENRRRSENRLNVLIENVKSGVALIDDTGKFGIVNPAFLLMFGLEDRETIKSINDQNWGDWQVFESDGTLLHVDEHPVRKVALTGKAVIDKLVGVRLPSGGDLVWMLISADPILRPDGSIESIICTYHDITDRRRAEEAQSALLKELQQAHEEAIRQRILLETVIGQMPIGLVVLDREGQTIVRNAKAEEMSQEPTYRDFFLHYHGTSKYRRDDGTFYQSEDLPAVRALRKGETIVAASMIFDAPDGRDVHLSINSTPLLDPEGRITGSVSVYWDITERKKAERAIAEHVAKLEEINKELESFSYSISHDLRAPLRAIDGYARMLLKKHGQEFDEDSMRKFNDIRSNAQMMGKLIDDILTLSRLGRAKMSVVDLEMEGIIKDLWKEQQHINPKRKMSLTIQSMPSGYGDRTLIKQVYANLLGNAVKFTKFKNPAQIEAGGYTDGNENVYYVKDNGVGFDMAYYDKLFGIFQRLHNNPDFEGTGVGLAIIQRAVHIHGGRVWAEGKVDEGATFFFSLPLSYTRTR